ncbi:very short patch repair endonuclease [Motilibacter sp. E257]|uniref:Very short patch repair endonuclease n=2 Tax=Motilibacter deserti TaxID=2714956 RepID=A0ABX0GSE3_9ACTN|nr:very short patch repair endonuclease [Motilibacter deserti]
MRHRRRRVEQVFVRSSSSCQTTRACARTFVTVNDSVSSGADRRARARQRAYERGVYPAPQSPGRSRNMQANRRRDTRPEQGLRRALHAAGYRFRVDYRLDLGDLRVRPDVVFPRVKVAIFVDGCFWHACPEHGRPPTTNTWYWNPKLRRNQNRDELVTGTLQAHGWLVLRFWEHEALVEVVERTSAVLAERYAELAHPRHRTAAVR